MPLNRLHWLLLAVLAGLWAGGQPLHAEAPKAPAPPPGFEEAMRPQQALIDIAYQGAVIGSFLATFRPGGIRFSDPVKIAAAVPGLRDPEAVAISLSGELPTHAEKLCGLMAAPDCGILEPEIAGVIFDADRFRAVLFLGPDFREAGRPKCFPAPPPDPCFVQSVSAAAAGSRAAGNASMRSVTILGLGPARLRADTLLSTEQDAQLDRLKAEYDLDTWRGEAGLFRFVPLPLLGDQRFLGVGIATTLDTLTDLNQEIGGQLTVFLAERSQVEIYRDGRLLSARSYEPGTRDLYTGELPDGAYFVTLRIIGPSGTREETRYFAKSLAIPPEGQPLWELRAGMLVEDDTDLVPAGSGTAILRGSTRHRIVDSLALGGEAVLSETEQGVGATAVYLLPQAELQFEGFATSQRDYGIGVGLRGEAWRLGFSGYLRRVWEGGSDATGLFDVGGNATQASASLTYLMDGPAIGLRATYNDTAGEGVSYSVGPTLSWPLLSGDGRRLDLYVDASTTDTEDFLRAQLRFSWGGERTRMVAQTGASGAIGADRGAGGLAAFGRIDGTHRVIDRDAEYLDLTATAASESDLSWLGSRLTYAGPRGRADAELEQYRDGDSRYRGNLVFNLVGTREGIALGGREARESAIVISVDGDPASEFDVLVDEQPRGVLSGGSRMVVSLRPYAAYDVRLVQRTGGYVDYDASTRQVVLFPGTVRWLTWEAEPVIAIFGRLLSENGRPLARARFQDVLPVTRTDADGYFQIEIPRSREALRLVVGAAAAGAPEMTCVLELPQVSAAEDFLNIGSRTCRRDTGR